MKKKKSKAFLEGYELGRQDGRTEGAAIIFCAGITLGEMLEKLTTRMLNYLPEENRKEKEHGTGS